MQMISTLNRAFVRKRHIRSHIRKLIYIVKKTFSGCLINLQSVLFMHQENDYCRMGLDFDIRSKIDGFLRAP